MLPEPESSRAGVSLDHKADILSSFSVFDPDAAADAQRGAQVGRAAVSGPVDGRQAAQRCDLEQRWAQLVSPVSHVSSSGSTCNVLQKWG